MQGIDIVAQMLAEKQAALLLGNIHMAYLYTFFLGAPVVVFGLNLHIMSFTLLICSSVIGAKVPSMLLIVVISGGKSNAFALIRLI